MTSKGSFKQMVQWSLLTQARFVPSLVSCRSWGRQEGTGNHLSQLRLQQLCYPWVHCGCLSLPVPISSVFWTMLRQETNSPISCCKAWSEMQEQFPCLKYSSPIWGSTVAPCTPCGNRHNHNPTTHKASNPPKADFASCAGYWVVRGGDKYLDRDDALL